MQMIFDSVANSTALAAKFNVNDIVEVARSQSGLRSGTVIRVCNFDGRWRYVLEADFRILGMFDEEDLKSAKEAVL